MLNFNKTNSHRQDVVRAPMRATLRPSQERGHFDHGWLKTFHTFSFADYYDPNHMGFSHLRVMNEDWIAGGAGFPTHGHRDMEIITYVMEGALEHQDSMGHHEVLKPLEVQRMTAGRAVRHSEFNHLKDSTTHLYQIWIEPSEKGLTPGYEQKDFSTGIKSGELTLIASPDARDGSLLIHQDVNIWAWKPSAPTTRKLATEKYRSYWIQVVRGTLSLTNGPKASAGDGIAITNADEIELIAGADAEALIFDLV